MAAGENMNILLSGAFDSFVQLIGALIIFAFVIGITYLTTRWMGGIQKGRNNNKNLHIIETIGVGNNKNDQHCRSWNGVSCSFCWKR